MTYKGYTGHVEFDADSLHKLPTDDILFLPVNDVDLLHGQPPIRILL